MKSDCLQIDPSLRIEHWGYCWHVLRDGQPIGSSPNPTVAWRNAHKWLLRHVCTVADIGWERKLDAMGVARNG